MELTGVEGNRIEIALRPKNYSAINCAVSANLIWKYFRHCGEH
jgi:hypothetical protein